MQGTGNDFVLLDRPAIDNMLLPEVARKLCDRHLGIGADGMLIIEDSQCADARMRIFNADGSEAQMCGNGIRCIAKYLFEKKIISSVYVKIETPDGIKNLTIHTNADGIADIVTVDMGNASLTCPDGSFIADTDYGSFNVIPVSTGNPHGIVIVENASEINIREIGPLLENHPYWSDRANIEFVSLDTPGHITQRTWERGVGETLACGTGACAAAFALVSRGLAAWPVSVRLSGGILVIDCDHNSGHILMTGPAENVFNTSVNLSIQT